MDNESLDKILRDAAQRQYWIVLWGYPDRSPDEGKQIFDDEFYDEGLTRNVRDMQIQDILFVHRIKVSKIMYVSEVIDPPRLSTDQETVQQPWRKRWKWSVRAKNVTPIYGRHWRSLGKKTFALADQFNALHSNEPVNLGRMNFGSHVKISRSFAEFLIDEIKQLEVGDRKYVRRPIRVVHNRARTGVE